MLIYIQNPDAGLVMSFKKWKELGRHVKKGQKAIEILAPIQKKVETPARDDTGRVLLDEDGKQVTKQSSYTYYKFVPVFADNQTEGEPLPSLIRDMEGDSEKFEFWYSQDNREYRIAMDYNLGVQVAFPNMVVKYIA